MKEWLEAAKAKYGQAPVPDPPKRQTSQSHQKIAFNHHYNSKKLSDVSEYKDTFIKIATNNSWMPTQIVQVYKKTHTTKW